MKPQHELESISHPSHHELARMLASWRNRGWRVVSVNQGWEQTGLGDVESRWYAIVERETFSE